ncbi:MAG: insulinase family protein [Propioniciclava sp.]|uniref:M16 family metallopeptidase n=1 Tax=Propioniciclava sp. TaxID=2038686 RepID=UPI0039E6D311
MSTPPRPAVVPPQPWDFPAARTTCLPNGLTVRLQHLPGQHVISIGLLLDVPLTSEPAGRDGLAQVWAASFTEGTQAHPGTSFADAVEDCGAVMEAGIGYSHVQALVDVPASGLAAALTLLAEAVITPTLTDADIERHGRLEAAHLTQQLATGSGLANAALRRAVVDPSFRASRGRAGWPDDLVGVAGPDVRAWRAATHGPRGAVLVISGEFGEDALALADAAFGSWTNPEQASVHHETPAGRPRAAYLIDRPGSVQADIRWGWFTIDRTDPRWAGLQLATNALGGAYLSRLNKVLREERGFSYGVSLTSAPLRSGGISYAYGSFRTEVVGEALALMPALIDVRQAPITEAELTRARDYLIGTTPLRYATAGGVTSGVLGLLAAGLDTDHIGTQLAAYRATSADQASAAASALLDVDAGSLVVVGDASALEQPLRDAGWDPQVRTADRPW